MKNSLKLKMAIVFILSFSFFGFVTGYPLIGLNHFRHSYMTASGQIVAVEPQNHNSCSYRFMLANKIYTGTGADCGHMAIGAPLKIYYFSSNPARSANDNPDNLWTDSLHMFLLAITWMPAVSTFVIYRSERRKISR